jgi:hypothetical protein
VLIDALSPAAQIILLQFIADYVPNTAMNDLVLSSSERFAMSLEGLYRAVAARIAGGGMMAWMIVAVCQRIRRVEWAFLALLARYEAGRLVVRKRKLDGDGAVCGAQRLGAGDAGDARDSRDSRSGVPALPRRFGWLLPLVPGEAVNFASQVRRTLEDPALRDLLATSPQARRILAPLLCMLGIKRSVLIGPARRVPDRLAPDRLPAEVRESRPAWRRPVPQDRREGARIALSREILAAARKDGFGKR